MKKTRRWPKMSPSEPPISSRGQRQQIGLDDPLLAGQATPEVVAQRGQRDVDHGRVQEHDP